MNMMVGGNIWHQRVLSMVPEYVRVVGRVIGRVFIRDLGREIRYNQAVDIPASDAVKSEDLLAAIDNKWLYVVYGKDYLKGGKFYNSQVLREPVSEQQPQSRQQLDLEQIKDLAVQIATKAAEDAADKAALRSVSSIKALLDEVVSKSNGAGTIDTSMIAAEIASKIGSGMSPTKKDIHISDDVFIDLSEQKELQTNIEGSLGEVTTKKDNKALSIAQKLKQIQQGDKNGSD